VPGQTGFCSPLVQARCVLVVKQYTTCLDHPAPRPKPAPAKSSGGDGCPFKQPSTHGAQEMEVPSLVRGGGEERGREWALASVGELAMEARGARGSQEYLIDVRPKATLTMSCKLR
jgi:hypothetical protein